MSTEVMSLRLEAGLAAAKPWRGQVVGVYEHAVSIRTIEDRLVSILAGLPGVPHSLHVPAPLLPRIKKHMPVQGTSGTITIGENTTILFHQSPVWNAAIPPLEILDPQFLARAVTVLDDYVEPAVSDGLPELESIVRTGGPAVDRENAVFRMIGRGVGLTPEGDDFLTGLLAGCDLLPLDGASQLRKIVRENLDRTTWVSRCFLQFALDREFSEPVGLVLAALTRSDSRLLRNATEILVSIGVSSGPATLRGLRTVLNYRKVC